MEWNWCWHGNDASPFMLCESSGDSEELKSNIHHHHHHEYDYHEATMDDVSFRFDDKEDVVDDNDDDAQSCSYDHSSYINTSYGSSHIDQSQRVTYDDHDMDDDDDDDDGDVVVDDDGDHNKMINKNWGESKLMDSSKQQNRSHKFCGDSLSQREIDKQFWETCLAS